jgi:anti-anti-sigma factor
MNSSTKQTIDTADNQHTVVCLPSDFSGYSVEQLKDQFDALAISATTSVVLDFSQTEFIDSSGIGAMVFLYKRLEKRAAQLALLKVHGQPYKLMNLLRVDRTIRFIESL